MCRHYFGIVIKKHYMNISTSLSVQKNIDQVDTFYRGFRWPGLFIPCPEPKYVTMKTVEKPVKLDSIRGRSN